MQNTYRRLLSRKAYYEITLWGGLLLLAAVCLFVSGTAGVGPGLTAGPIVPTGGPPARAPPSQGTRDPNSKFSDEEVRPRATGFAVICAATPI